MGWKAVGEGTPVVAGERYRLTLWYKLPFNSFVIGTIKFAIGAAAKVGGKLAGFEVLDISASPPAINSRGAESPWALRVEVKKK